MSKLTTKQRIEVIEKELQELKQQLEVEDSISAEQFLLNILGNELTLKIDKEKYPNSVFYFKGDKCLLELQKSDDMLYLWCNYDEIWNPISIKFSLNYASTKTLIKVTVEEHFKLRDVTPENQLARLVALVEEHFKLRDVTPKYLGNLDRRLVEEHFKLRDVTPTTK